MPLYEYECTACHRHTEKIQKFSDPEITICPSCGGGLERVISAPAIAFKGGGWYSDGYGNAKPKVAGSSEGGSSEGSSGAGAGSQSKPSTDSSNAPATPSAAPAAAPAASSPASPAPAKS